MKKVFFTTMLLCVLGISSASAQAIWGVKLGLSKPSMPFTCDENVYVYDKWTTDGVFGFQAGPVVYITLVDRLYLNFGILYDLKIFKDDLFILNTYSIDIPLYLGYDFSIIRNASLYGQAGPYMELKFLEQATYSGKSYDGDALLTTFNAGLGLAAGVKISRVRLELGYQFGLANVLNDKNLNAKDLKDDYNAKLRINSLSLSIGIMF